MEKKSKKLVHKKTKKAIGRGSELSCRECGLRVTVVDDCDCASPCDIMCCGEQMIVIG